MTAFFRFLYEFISIFFDGLFDIFKGIFSGIGQMFNINDYRSIINSYKDGFGGGQWILVAVSIALLVIFVGLIGLMIFLFIRKVVKQKRSNLNQADLLEEIAYLNDQVR